MSATTSVVDPEPEAQKMQTPPPPSQIDVPAVSDFSEISSIRTRPEFYHNRSLYPTVESCTTSEEGTEDWKDGESLRCFNEGYLKDTLEGTEKSTTASSSQAESGASWKVEALRSSDTKSFATGDYVQNGWTRVGSLGTKEKDGRVSSMEEILNFTDIDEGSPEENDKSCPTKKLVFPLGAGTDPRISESRTIPMQAKQSDDLILAAKKRSAADALAAGSTRRNDLPASSADAPSSPNSPSSAPCFVPFSSVESPDLRREPESQEDLISVGTYDIRIGVGATVPGAVNVLPSGGDGPTFAEPEEPVSDEESRAVPEAMLPGSLSFQVTAVRVNDPDIERAQLEAEIRNQVLQEVVQADAVTVSALKCPPRKWPWKVLVLFALLVVGLVVGLSLGLRNETHNSHPWDRIANNTKINNASMAATPTLQRVRDRGFVICGIRTNFPGLSDQNAASGEWEGLSIDQCQAISIAVFGNPYQYQVVSLNRKNRLTMLLEGQVDVLSIFLAWSMASDVFSSYIQSGIWFSTPYLYSGFGFVGQPEYTQCGDKLDSWSPACRAIKSCVVETSVNRDTLQRLLPGGQVVLCDTAAAVIEKFAGGECNVIATWPFGSQEKIFRRGGYEGDFVVGKKLFTHEDLSLMARDDDPEWSRIIETVVQTFIFAEANNITKANAHEMRSLFGDGTNSSLAVAMEAIVSEFGNYGDLYERHFQQMIPRRGFNLLYSQPTAPSGLLYSLPFRNLDTVGPGPTPNGTLDRILHRGYLICGLTNSSRERRALDTEFCYAVAAAIFAGDKTRIQLVNLGSNGTSSLLHACEALEEKAVDLVAGVRLSLQVLLGMPPFDHQFYAFSKPYFYDTQTVSAFTLMYRADDSQWDSFVFWVAMSLIYAEEEEITQSLWPQMPVTSLFGESLKQCFRDAVFAVGHYGEMYNRTLESVWPRSGGNLLNDGSGEGYGPQHFPIPLF